MCEIAILDPQHRENEFIASSAETIYQHMRDSLGIVAVQDVGGEFNYEIYKDTEPDYGAVLDFVQRHADDTARFVIHGRLATTGAVNDVNAHPIGIDCEQCSVDYVLHNGVIRGHERLREAHEDEGHEYASGVDSEVIAHQHQHVPDDFDAGENDLFGHEPAYILLGDSNMYVYSSRRYRLTEDCRMALGNRQYSPSRKETNHVEVILHPSEEE